MDLFESIVASFEGMDEKVKLSKDIVSKEFIESTLNKFEQTLVNEVQSWEDELKDNLSDQLPMTLLGRKRPQNRKYPFKVKGNILSNLKYNVEHFKINNKHYRFKVEHNIHHEHAYYTNMGIAGKYQSSGGWVGWYRRSTLVGGTSLDRVLTQVIGEFR